MTPPPLHAFHDVRLLGLSILIALVAVFTAVDLAGRVVRAPDATRRWWMLSAAGALGCGIWAFHFTGLLALRIATPIGYDWWLVAASLALGVACCLIALSLVLRAPMSGRVLAGWALLFAGAVSAMHYVGMAAMRTDLADRSWSPVLIVVSCLPPAVAAAVAAKVLTTDHEHAGPSLRRRFAVALILGLGVVVMHHVAMQAVTFSGPATPMVAVRDEPTLVAALVAALALLVLGAALAQSFVDRRAAQDAAVIREVMGVLRDMSSGSDGRQAVCEAAQRITGCSAAMLFEPGGGTGRPPTVPTALARSGEPPSPDGADRRLYRAVVAVWADGEARVVPDSPGGGLLLEPVVRGGESAGVLCLRFHGRTGDLSRRRRSAVRLLAVEAGIAIQRAEFAVRTRAADRADAAARLARDLHDSVSQEVAVSSVYAQMAIKCLDDGESGEARRLLSETAELLGRTERDLRDVLQSLRRGHRVEGTETLPELVDALAAEHERRGRARVEVARDVLDWTRIEPDLTDALYFAVREALHNALKHAGGAPVHVELRAGAETVRAVVRDEGPGFDVGDVPPGRWGLVGLYERAQRLGGQAEVTSARGSGTTVSVVLPRAAVPATRPLTHADQRG